MNKDIKKRSQISIMKSDFVFLCKLNRGDVSKIKRAMLYYVQHYLVILDRITK